MNSENPYPHWHLTPVMPPSSVYPPSPIMPSGMFYEQMRKQQAELEGTTRSNIKSPKPVPYTNSYTLPTPPTSQTTPVVHDFTQHNDTELPLISRSPSVPAVSKAPLFQSQTTTQGAPHTAPYLPKVIPGRFTCDKFMCMVEAIRYGETGLPPNVTKTDLAIVYDARISHQPEEVPFYMLLQSARKFLRLQITDADEPAGSSHAHYLMSQMPETCWTAAIVLAYTGYLHNTSDVWTANKIIKLWEATLDTKSPATNTLEKNSNIPPQTTEKKSPKVAKPVPQVKAKVVKSTTKRRSSPPRTPAGNNVEHNAEDNAGVADLPGPFMLRTPSNESSNSNNSTGKRKRKASSDDIEAFASKKVKASEYSDEDKPAKPKAHKRGPRGPNDLSANPPDRFARVVKLAVLNIQDKGSDEEVMANLKHEWHTLCPTEPMTLSPEENNFIHSRGWQENLYLRLKYQIGIGAALLTEQNRRIQKVRSLMGAGKETPKLMALNKTQIQLWCDKDANRSSPVFVKLQEIGWLPTMIINDKLNQHYLDKYPLQPRKVIYEHWAACERLAIDEVRHNYIPLSSEDEPITRAASLDAPVMTEA